MHTAAFPQKLVETCIKAGTSEKGACPLCGAQWSRLLGRPCEACGEMIARQGKKCEACGHVREWKKGRGVHAGVEEPGKAGRGVPRLPGGFANKTVPMSQRDGGLTAEDGLERTGMSHQKYDEWLKANPLADAGWVPGCECQTQEGVPYAPVRPLVIDPCGGSGTVGVVAERLGRDSILIELSPTYAEQARARIADPEWATKERKRQRQAKRDKVARPAGTDGWASTRVQPDDDGPSMGREDAERVMLAGYDEGEEGRA